MPLPPGIVCPTFPGTARGDLQYQDQERARLAADAIRRAQGAEAARGAEGGGYYAETGLGDEHYADVNRREEKEYHRLALREKGMNRRMLRIAGDEEDLVGQPVLGNNGQLMAMKAETTALATYVPLPLTPELEQQRIVASFDTPRLTVHIQTAPLLVAR